LGAGERFYDPAVGGWKKLEKLAAQALVRAKYFFRSAIYQVEKLFAGHKRIQNQTCRSR
jgi:hypothetical protein